MKLINRLRRIWNLGEYEVKGTDRGFEIRGGNIIPKEPVKMAQIIKRTNPTQEFLKDEPQNEPT